jgi:NAD(P)H-quinone oxidoreductase subunit 5
MSATPVLEAASLAPVVLMLLALPARASRPAQGAHWARMLVLSTAATLSAGAVLVWRLWHHTATTPLLPGLALFPFAAWMALLVQFLGTVIAAFSARYLQGEGAQRAYLRALAGVLAGVQLLLLADHWLVLIAAWAAIGSALHRLLCFYPERPFALLAAHKKRIADRLADLLLLAAAGLAWWSVGSGSLAVLARHLAQAPAAPALQFSAVLLVLAVVLRTALLPVHGWLIQVMEAPTPVSALLHAGVVNLGGYVLLRFAPLLDAVPAARWLLVACGLGSAALAGMVSLTRISIKVRLAWSTVAQMGFMVLECGLGLYALAALHLLGHSLYKAQAFLSASDTVRQSRLRELRGPVGASAASVLGAPFVAAALLWLVQRAAGGAQWPWWWSLLLALAWAPLLWLPAASGQGVAAAAWRAVGGLLMVAALGLAACFAHRLELGVQDLPWQPAGSLALLGMGLLYLVLGTLQIRPRALSAWRRWSYAGFYTDEVFTRVALRLWPARWGSASQPRDAGSAQRATAWSSQ